ncbi:MAG: hypothetical protein K6G05_08840 [Lachnospiraceae bacterium]|nr:hypothetical protein [Lachnospiraceae bacterium]
MYEKPIVLTVDDMAEGVFAASGSKATEDSGNTTTSTISYRIGNDLGWAREIVFTGLTDYCPDYKITAKFNKDVTSASGSASVTCKGKTVTIKNWGSNSDEFILDVKNKEAVPKTIEVEKF